MLMNNDHNYDNVSQCPNLNDIQKEKKKKKYNQSKKNQNEARKKGPDRLPIT